MSWLQKLHDTYEACKGREAPGSPTLMPISHTTQQAQIEIVLDGQGQFRRAAVIDKGRGTTLIPCTEESGGRAGSKPVPHPLCDKLQYLAADYLRFGGEVTSGYAKDPGEPYRLYLAALQAWTDSAQRHPKLNAIFRYVQQGRVVADLARYKLLPVDDSGLLAKTWLGDKQQMPTVFKSLNAGQAPEDVFVRWRVEDDDPASGTWEDAALIEAWIAYYATLQQQRGFCMVLGQDVPLAIQHPSKLRNAGDKAKLISANDDTGFTFRGRFLESSQALGVGFEVTQKAHNALRWLIARQGSRQGDQAIVAWAVSGAPVPDPMENSYAMLFGEQPMFASATIEDAGQPFAWQLKRAIAGYQARLQPGEGVVVMALDSATPGRMAITYYRELAGSEFLHHIEAWHLRCAWPQNFGKDRKFIGAPAPADIAEAAYGPRVDDKLKQSTRERLLPCIVDAAPVPRNLADSAARRAVNRVGLEPWDWKRTLGIACALFRGLHMERNYQMALETDRRSRDYLFGRLLAIAEHIEGRALFIAGENGRTTNAARLMQRFADRPASTWRSIALALVPYQTRLRNLRPPFLSFMENLVDEVVSAFEPDDFRRDTALSPEFLLGYHCQRQHLRVGPTAADDNVSEPTPQ
ncbi:type I-C CRISPR-associated protein Cas8c/Csd1 [Pseudorhodoferax sp. Leaf267]|uniref:type I-C CRISPR-associated protein Cas8c/Csd1 n=1 Tax=Pseudorhodoferax sp. Leaf267 TaxID=1736316 RepID=UPI0007020A76|nr:type I-C CRISPR-associated protein Cas8c/Csd1 [Pseudorhodoferax sp. Leaf267]KQP21730.1 hypothetical protein ASF43_25855 [Pseudorhodoferax sp. Leaf267]